MFHKSNMPSNFPKTTMSTDRWRLAVIFFVCGFVFVNQSNHLTANLQALLVKNTNNDNNNNNDHNNHAKTQPRKEPNQSVDVQNCNCVDKLGKNGSWVRDWDFAEKYGQYPSPRVVPRGPFQERTRGKFRPSAEAPFPWETSWKWVDRSQEHCQIDYTMNADKFCSILKSMNVDRILFLGDSLSDSQCTSLLNKMGSTYIRDHSRKTADSQEATLVCDNETLVENSSISIRCTREAGGQDFPNSPRHNMTLSNTTRDFMLGNWTNKDHKGLLAILNMGAHYHKVKDYQEDTDILLEWVDSYTKPTDMVFFRTTPSGHIGCEPRQPRSFDFQAGIRHVPLSSYDEFQPTNKFEWNLFDEYNAYTRQVVVKRNRHGNNNNNNMDNIATENIAPVRIEMLDVVNMTILRSDGHSGGPDCLHYVEPGPVDWWNHLLYSLLKEKSHSQSSNC